MNIEATIGLIIGAGVVVGGLGYFVSQFMKGRGDLITYMKNQIEGFQGVVVDLQNKNTELTNKVANQEALIKARDDTVKLYLSILENRSPEFAQFMGTVSQMRDEFTAHMVEDRARQEGFVKSIAEIVAILQKIDSKIK